MGLFRDVWHLTTRSAANSPRSRNLVRRESAIRQVLWESPLSRSSTSPPEELGERSPLIPLSALWTGRCRACEAEGREASSELGPPSASCRTHATRATTWRESHRITALVVRISGTTSCWPPKYVDGRPPVCHLRIARADSARTLGRICPI